MKRTPCLLAMVLLAPLLMAVAIVIQDEGGTVAIGRYTFNFTGAGVTCVDNVGGNRVDCTITSGGGGAPTTAEYVTTQDDAGLSADVFPGADDQVIVSDSATAATWRGVPNCGEAGTLNYDVAINTFSCLTDTSGNSVETTLVLSNGSGYFAVTVTGQAWVTSTSEIVCAPLGTTADGLTPEAIAVADLGVSVANRVAATGFDVLVYSPNGLDGTLRVHCIGV